MVVYYLIDKMQDAIKISNWKISTFSSPPKTEFENEFQYRTMLLVFFPFQFWMCDCRPFLTLHFFFLVEKIINKYFSSTPSFAITRDQGICLNIKCNFWGAAIAQWICLRLPFCCPGFESQAHHLRFYYL